MQDLPPIEGVTPGMLWTALIVLIAGAGLYVLYGKVRETYAKNKKLKDPEGKLADEISAKVLENLEPRFAEIERKLSNDNNRIDENVRELNEHRKRMDSMETGQRAMCRGVLALLSHEINGNSTDKLKEAQTGISNYLIDK